MWFLNRSDTNRAAQAQKRARSLKESLTNWPVYAYTLEVKNTFIKLLMLILFVEDNTFMSCEDIHAKIFAYFVHYLVEI